MKKTKAVYVLMDVDEKEILAVIDIREKNPINADFKSLLKGHKNYLKRDFSILEIKSVREYSRERPIADWFVKIAVPADDEIHTLKLTKTNYYEPES